jgi:lipoprotein-anchoring transpeptidase ErfK/SrfK
MYNIRALGLAPFLLLAACEQPSSSEALSVSTPAPVVAMGEFSRVEMARINAAAFATSPLAEPAIEAPAADATILPPGADMAPVESIVYNAALVRIQVLLDRAHFSPGVIDGFDGENVAKAVSAYQTAHALAVNGRADDTLLQTLTTADPAGALSSYVIAASDVVGPFGVVPTDLEAMSQLEHVGYADAAEGLAEKFHMDVDLLRTLNPGADFARAGTELVVANAGGGLATMVASIEIDKPGRAVRAYSAEGLLLAYYPATIGSEAAPAPIGVHEVRAIAFDPTYHYDAARLPTFGQRAHGPLTIQAGPNNPVGAVWIALSLDTYGIHGAPEASLVSKTQSHGCVRLTNWDAVELARAVRAGTPVSFLESSADALVARNG